MVGGMRFPDWAAKQFQSDLDVWGPEFLAQLGSGAITRADLSSDRFIARSVLPHVSQLLARFVAGKDWSQYWKETSNAGNLRAAYLMAFGWSNQLRFAAVWSELARLGFRFRAPKSGTMRAIEWGAGLAAVPTGVAWAEKHFELGLPEAMTWAMLERDQAALRFGAQWSEFVFARAARPDWGVQMFHRTLDPAAEWLPRSAPQFSLWATSFFLNELWESTPIDTLAERLIENWTHHLEEGGLVVLVEPAIPAQSRKLLELRAALLPRLEQIGMQLLLPCLGHQACGALVKPKDWCHEEVRWWRPEIVARIDRLAGMDRKTLDMSYLVLVKDRRPIAEILPGLPAGPLQRLVSPATRAARDREFFFCGADGKRRGRLQTKEDLERGDILGAVEHRGSPEASRIVSAQLPEIPKTAREQRLAQWRSATESEYSDDSGESST